MLIGSGTYTGQCKEFCGLSHAYMKFTVVAQSPDWLAADLVVDVPVEGAESWMPLFVVLREGADNGFTLLPVDYTWMTTIIGCFESAVRPTGGAR